MDTETMKVVREKVTDHAFVTAVTIGRDGKDVRIGMITGSGHHIVTIPASAVEFIRERL